MRGSTRETMNREFVEARTYSIERFPSNFLTRLKLMLDEKERNWKIFRNFESIFPGRSLLRETFELHHEFDPIRLRRVKIEYFKPNLSSD